ncbi:MAG TPA: universal stress protein [Cytophagales bacterium]|jgi:nucleotide-binding universal stress UspA family protein|nr:universal stress protein [Cytophagales bacterium]
MKKILVPCDFTSTSNQAFRFACEIAKKNKAELFLLHVVEMPVLHSSLMAPVFAYESSYLKGVKAKVNSIFENMKSKWGAKLKIHLAVEHGPISASIKKFVLKKGINLIVMGTHGSSGIREFTIGSNTEKIVRTSSVPVIAVKKAMNVPSVKNIIFPTDLSIGSKDMINALKVLQNLFKAKLQIITVNTPLNFNSNSVIQKRFQEFIQQTQLKNYQFVVYNDVTEELGITNFTAQQKNKIIAMPTHGRRGLSHLLSGSIAENVVNHIDCPIWTYREA